MTITDEQLARINANRNTALVAAARYNDQVMDAQLRHSGPAGSALPVILRAAGIDLNLVKYVYEQRTMRLGVAPDPTTFALFLDALFIGWTGRKFYNGSVETSGVYIHEPITREQWEAWTQSATP